MKCPFGCRGELRNIEGKRHTRERLIEIHRPTCPSVPRSKTKTTTTTDGDS